MRMTIKSIKSHCSFCFPSCIVCCLVLSGEGDSYSGDIRKPVTPFWLLSTADHDGGRRGHAAGTSFQWVHAFNQCWVGRGRPPGPAKAQDASSTFGKTLELL